jgi:hypothetical protein
LHLNISINEIGFNRSNRSNTIGNKTFRLSEENRSKIQAQKRFKMFVLLTNIFAQNTFWHDSVQMIMLETNQKLILLSNDLIINFLESMKNERYNCYQNRTTQVQKSNTGPDRIRPKSGWQIWQVGFQCISHDIRFSESLNISDYRISIGFASNFFTPSLSTVSSNDKVTSII